jgi:glycosyltransferase involved in cell wall biosynthesis
MFLSVVIPARDTIGALQRLFASISLSRRQPDEVILVDDGSPESLESTAAAFGAKYLRLDRSAGPATARNCGVSLANGEVILFLDSDVTVHPDTIGRLAGFLEANPEYSAIIGSYDDAPGSSRFLSRYRNLLHTWIHRTASPEACTFWGACGAIRREALEAVGGFPESYSRPAIEDIEFGNSLIKAGYRIRLDRDAQVCHHKEWRFLDMIHTDVFDRAIPWTLLILREGKMPDDLNVSKAQRRKAVLAVLVLCLLPAILIDPLFALLFLVALVAFVFVNGAFYAFLARRKGLMFAIRAIPVHWLYFLYSCAGFAMGVVLHLAAGRAASREAGRSPAR